MPKYADLTPAEGALLDALVPVFRKHPKVAGNFQLAHRISQRIAALAADEVLMMEKVAAAPGKPKFLVTKQKKPAKAATASEPDPCCYWEWVCEDPDVPETCGLVCVGTC